jgi:hypothetical protein
MRKFIAAENDAPLAAPYPDWRELAEQQASRSGACGAISGARHPHRHSVARTTHDPTIGRIYADEAAHAELGEVPDRPTGPNRPNPGAPQPARGGYSA